jgi:hypothetical protein
MAFRATEAVREAVEVEAEKSNRSISDVINDVLDRAFVTKAPEKTRRSRAG